MSYILQQKLKDPLLIRPSLNFCCTWPYHIYQFISYPSFVQLLELRYYTRAFEMQLKYCKAKYSARTSTGNQSRTSVSGRQSGRREGLDFKCKLRATTQATTSSSSPRHPFREISHPVLVYCTDLIINENRFAISLRLRFKRTPGTGRMTWTERSVLK